MIPIKFWLRRFQSWRNTRSSSKILGGGDAAERSWGRRMSRFRRWKSLNAWTSSRPARRWGRRHFVQQALFDMAVESLEPRVLMTHHVGSLDNSYTYPYTAPVTADVLEIDVTTEGWGRITAKQGASTLQTDTFTQFKAVEIDASGGAVNDTVTFLGSPAKVAINDLQTLTIKTGEGNDTVDFSKLAA